VPVISRIDRVEAEIAAAAWQASVEERDAWHVADTSKQLAIACGLIGAPLVFFGLTWSASGLLPVIGGMLWVVAVVAAQSSMKARTRAQQVETKVQDRLAQLQERRNALIPPPAGEFNMR
jgi:type IV secretory pathway TrbD component